MHNVNLLSKIGTLNLYKIFLLIQQYFPKYSTIDFLIHMLSLLELNIHYIYIFQFYVFNKISNSYSIQCIPFIRK